MASTSATACASSPRGPPRSSSAAETQALGGLHHLQELALLAVRVAVDGALDQRAQLREAGRALVLARAQQHAEAGHGGREAEGARGVAQRAMLVAQRAC